MAIGGRKDGKADGPDLGALGAIFGLSRDFDPSVVDGDHIKNRYPAFPALKSCQHLVGVLRSRAFVTFILLFLAPCSGWFVCVKLRRGPL